MATKKKKNTLLRLAVHVLKELKIIAKEENTSVQAIIENEYGNHTS